MENPLNQTDYSERVLQHFDAPSRAAPLPGRRATRTAGAGEIRSGRATSKARLAWVEFHLAVADGKVEAAAFQAQGCPHLLAGADIVAAHLEGLAVANLAEYTAEFLERELPLPPEKLDIRILLEDAVRAVATDAGRTSEVRTA